MSTFGLDRTRGEFLSKFPDGTYSNYVMYSLAFTYASSSNETDKKKAIEYLRRLKAIPDFTFSDEVERKLKELQPYASASEAKKP